MPEPSLYVLSPTDDDLICDVVDTDDDGDGTPDATDAFPLDAAEDTDTDGDGTGNNADLDDDDDGLTDSEEAAIGTNPLLVDTDLDTLFDGDEVLGGTNPLLADTDSDGTDDAEDNCPSSRIPHRRIATTMVSAMHARLVSTLIPTVCPTRLITASMSRMDLWPVHGVAIARRTVIWMDTETPATVISITMMEWDSMTPISFWAFTTRLMPLPTSTATGAWGMMTSTSRSVFY